MRVWALWGVLSICVFLIAGCPPQQIIYHKETERNAPPRPGIHGDHFLYGKSKGPVDLLFVVDNTESIEPGLAQFRRSFLSLLDQLNSEAARLIDDVRIQIVTASQMKMPESYIGKGASKTQLAEFFDDQDPTSLKVPMFTESTRADYREKGFPKPTEAFAKGIQSNAFEKREGVPLFAIFILAHDLDPATSDEQLVTQFAAMGDLITEKRGLFKTHLFSLTRNTLSPGPESFSHCGEFSPSPRFLTNVASIRWATQTPIDLCQKKWSSWEGALFSSIINAKKELVLSFRPFEPETMTLRHGTHLFRYGDDYVIDPVTNSINFLIPPKLQEGDLLEAFYFLKPVDPEFSGSPTPVRTPKPKRRS